MKHTLRIFFIILVLLAGCREEKAPVAAHKPVATPSPAPQATTQPAVVGCLGCHQQMQLDANHQLACTRCHHGQDHIADQEKAHSGLIALPAHPRFMAQTCGPCHPEQVDRARKDVHFTLAQKTNLIRHHFGATDTLDTAAAIPVQTGPITSPLALADDMLRRRCLRCHVYRSGDAYAAVRHATGCASCHLVFNNGRLKSHAFSRPQDSQCLSCHYANHVGADYYGRYEHDFNWEYRTPYLNGTTAPRPYGVENHELSPDIHQQRGLLCIDCHQASGHATGPGLRCASCHGWQPGQPPPAANLRVQNNTLLLQEAQDNSLHPVPPLRHPAHQQYGDRVSCQVCHAQWAFNDGPTSLLLSQSEDFDPWIWLTVQSSSEVEKLLDHNLAEAEPFLEPAMRDGLTGSKRPGIWYKGFTQRRWENMIIQQDRDGVIKVFRPMLDLRLSQILDDDRVPFDNIRGQGSGLLPYTPHTTGHAGLFYKDRFQKLLNP